MQRINVDNTGAIELAAKVLRQGGVAAIPTETVYGLMTLWGNKAGYDRIYALKHRPKNKLLQMLAGSAEMAEHAGIIRDDRLDRIIRTFCPGPLTIVASDGQGGSIGMRIPDHPFIKELLDCLEQPLAATSANLSGEQPALNAADAVSGLDGTPDILVDGGAIPDTGGKPSTVVSFLNGEPEILREGPVSLQDILSVWNS